MKLHNTLHYGFVINKHPVIFVVNGKECSVIHDEVTPTESSSLFQKVMIIVYKPSRSWNRCVVVLYL